MKVRKNLVCYITLVALILLSVFLGITTAQTFSSNSAQLSPAATTSTITGVISSVESGTTSTSSWSVGPSPDPNGTTVSVDIRIDGATPATIWGWTVDVNWTSSILQLTRVKQGNFLTDSGDSTLMLGTSSAQWDNVGGSILGGLSCADSSSLNAQTPDISGVLATLTFKVVGYGAASIILTKGNMRASSTDATGTTVTTNNATITAVSPASSSSYLVNFDETGLPSITQWAVVCNGQSNSSKSSQISFSLPPGSYSYSIAAVSKYSASPQSGNITISSTAQNVFILFSSTSLSNGASIDVFTDHGGIGQSVNGSAYGPQELVQIYALVLYNNASVASQDVSFVMLDGNGSVIANRVMQTNATGIAYAEYRMPTPDPSTPEISFGTWSITASVNLGQGTINDTTYFTFGYLSAITNSSVHIPTSIQTGENLPIQITINNLSNTTHWSELDITLFDQAQIPIGSYTTTNIGSALNETVNASILIPSWAFPGQATANICLLSSDGTAMGPENAVNFQITPNTGTATLIPAIVGTLFEAPEYAWGGLAALIVCLAAFIGFKMIEKRRQHSANNN